MLSVNTLLNKGPLFCNHIEKVADFINTPARKLWLDHRVTFVNNKFESSLHKTWSQSLFAPKIHYIVLYIFLSVLAALTLPIGLSLKKISLCQKKSKAFIAAQKQFFKLIYLRQQKHETIQELNQTLSEKNNKKIVELTKKLSNVQSKIAAQEFLYHKKLDSYLARYSNKSLDTNIQQIIDQQVVDEACVKQKLEENIALMHGYNPTGSFDHFLPAYVQAEKIRMHFNSKSIPVGYTSRGFEDYVITAILKQKPSCYLQSKRVKPLIFSTKNAKLEKNDHDRQRSIFSLSSNLYDSTHGESHTFYLNEGTQSLCGPHHESFKKQIRSLLKHRLIAANRVYALYSEYNEKLKKIHASRVLYVVAFTDVAQNKNILRLSKSFGDLHPFQPQNIHAYLLECNQKTKLKKQIDDCPQLRAIKPAANADNGLRVFRCYRSAEQKKLHKEFKIKLQKALKTFF